MGGGAEGLRLSRPGLRVLERNALLADIVSEVAYARAYVVERMMDNLGAIFGRTAMALPARAG